MNLYFVSVLFILVGAEENASFDELIENAKKLLKTGLKEYPHLHLHLSLPENEDFTRIGSDFGDEVVRYTEAVLREFITRSETNKELKEKTLNCLETLISQVETEDKNATLLIIKNNLWTLINSMMGEMNEGYGNLDFVMDDVARFGLGDIYFYVKSKISESIMNLKSQQAKIDLSHPFLLNVWSFLKEWNEEQITKVLKIILGAPGLQTQYIRPQLQKIRSTALVEFDKKDFKLLVSTGEWLNDVLNSGLVAIRDPFVEIRGRLTEMIGSMKDSVVSDLEKILAKLDPYQNEIGFLWDDFNIVIRKYFGQF